MTEQDKPLPNDDGADEQPDESLIVPPDEEPKTDEVDE